MRRIAAMLLCLLLFLSTICFSVQALSIDYGHFNTIAEYEALLKRSYVPSGFIDARDLYLLGEPDYGLVQAPDWSAYYYLFSTGISISIRHNCTTLIYSDPSTKPLPDDTISMRQIAPLSDGKSFSYFRNGMYYGYSGSGKLACIEWFANDIYFCISIDDRALQSRNPLLERLLSPSEAIATTAFQELCDAAGLSPLTKSLWESQARANRILTSILITITILTFVVSYLFEKKRRARGIVTRRQQRTTRDAIGEIPLTTFTSHESPFDTPNSH